jgi:hypothetical protein
MTNAYFKSALYLKNGLKTGPLTVTPALYLSNGVRLPLAPVTMEPSGTAVVNINQALADQGLTSYASLNGYVEITFQWAWDAVCATVRNVDTVHSLTFISNLQPLPPPTPADQPAASTPPVQNLEGMWWKEESNVTGFVALSNVTGSPIDAAIQVLDDQNNNLGNHSVTVSPHGTKIVNLNELLSATTPRGGVTMSYTGSPDALLVSAELEDEAVGYSAHLPIGPSPKASNPLSESSFAELGLMTGAQDSMMNFPRGTVFTPYSVVRNSSDQPLSVTPTLWWMQGSSAHSSLLPPFAVPPHRTQTLDISSYLTMAGLKNYNGDVNLVLDTKGQSGGLLAAAGSVDQTKTYVFEVMPRGFTESISKSFAYWSTANGDDTMVTIWNPADEQQDFLFTLYYAGGHNSFPIYLGPRESRSLNVSEFTMEGIHDADGNLVLMEAQSGSAEISGAQGENEHILIAADAAVYNVIKATCGVVCESCNGFTGVQLVVDGFSVPVGNTTQETFSVTYNTGAQYNRTNLSTWSSTNNSIASVTSGLISGVSAGSATVSALDSYEETVFLNNYCNGPPLPPCPIAYAYPGGQAGGSVTPTIGGPNTVWYFNGLTVSGYATSIQLTSSGGSSTTWTVTAGANKINLSSYSGSPITVTSSGTAFSSSVGDVKITAAANGQTSSPFSITTRTPSTAVQGTIINACDQTYGYLTTLNYTIYDQMPATLPAGVPVNENWTTGVVNDYSGTNWRRRDPNGVVEPGSGFADTIGGEAAAYGPPLATCDGNSTPVEHWGQEWRVGSIATGFGRRIQTDTLQKYIGHAAHVAITSPAP